MKKNSSHSSVVTSLPRPRRSLARHPLPTTQGALLSSALFLFLAGCTTPKAPEPELIPPAPRAPEVAAAENLFESGNVPGAIIACVDIAKKNPGASGLSDLQQRINQKLADERLADAEKRSEATVRLSSADSKRFAITPETYRQTKHVIGDRSPLRTAPTNMQKVLTNPVTVHLVNADINAIIAQIGQSQNINIIADSDISPKALTIHAENTPLVEILEYIGRNLNVTFSVGNNLIWVTPKEEVTTGVPMETRVYRLRKGMVGSELGKSAQGVSLFKGPEERGRGTSSDTQANEGEKKSGDVGLLQSIERFVPQPEGADFLFNDKVHALVVKNTRENLELVENLIEAMDVRPLQILIEARFVTTIVSDLRELGVDWLFQKPHNGGTDSGAIASLTALQQSATTAEEVLSIQNQINQLKAVKFNQDAFAGTVGSGGGNAIYQFLLGNTGLQATLHALETSGKSRTIVVPRVTTLNNREARFRVGEDVSYFEEVDTNIMTSGGYNSSNSRDNVTYDYDRPTIVETGYSLIVTPSVGADLSTINLVLRPEISSVKEWKKYKLSSLGNAQNPEDEPAIEIPILSRQYIETEAVVRSGETVVLGGLADNTKTEDLSGVPWVSKLPLIGRLFGSENKNEATKNILIFVTATLISDVGEELIPLNDFERYGLAVPEDAKVPDILKNAPAPDAAAPATAEEPAAPAAEAPAAVTAP